jgi:CspA family cold shock protein
MTGTVKKKTDRGFGFISIQGQDKDLFFHSSSLVGVTFDALQEGATVSFDVEDGENGRQSAKNVKLSEGGATESAPAEEPTQSGPTETAEEAAPAVEEPAEETK